VVLFTAAGSYEYFVLGLVEHDGLGRTFRNADAASLAIPNINGGDTLSINLGNLPWAHPDTGEAGYTLVPLNPSSFAFIEDILVGYIALLITHIPERLYNLCKTDILRAYKNAAFTLGTEPEQV
jgi:hypothetical protein